MAFIQEIKRKMTTVQSTIKITNAMKMVSRAKFVRFKKQFKEVNYFFNEFYKAVGQVVLSLKKMPKPLENPKTLWVMMSSSLGLCGQHNTNMNKLLQTKFQPGDKIFFLGRKNQSFWNKGDTDNPTVGYVDIQDRDLSFDYCQQVSDQIMEQFDLHQLDRICIIYTQFKNPLIQHVNSFQVFPFDVAMFKAFNPVKMEQKLDFEPDEETIIKLISPQFFDIALYGGLVETKLCESASRQNAMDAAAKNAKDLYEKYSIQFNKLRQNSITQEIIEIIGGIS